MVVKIGHKPFSFDDETIYASDEADERGKTIVDILIVFNGVVWSLILHPYVVDGLKWVCNMAIGSLYHFY